MIQAKVVADSITRKGHRLVTIEVTLHRFVLAEFNTHRVFSRNSASSRAIPVTRQLARLLAEPANPVVWPCEQPGMQGGADLTGVDLTDAEGMWERVRENTVGVVGDYLSDHPLDSSRLHKSVVNRVLEPFMWHTIIVSSTAWENFFGLRLDEHAQPEIREAAQAMRAVFDASVPTKIEAGQWHLPYIDAEDVSLVMDGRSHPWAELARISGARCARVSYLTHDGRRDHGNDLDLYARLVAPTPMHASALEHPSTPDEDNVQHVMYPFLDSLGQEQMHHATTPRFGNFLGWRQLRLEVEAAKNIKSYS